MTPGSKPHGGYINSGWRQTRGHFSTNRKQYALVIHDDSLDKINANNYVFSQRWIEEWSELSSWWFYRQKMIINNLSYHHHRLNMTRASKKDNLMKKESRGRFNDRDNLRLFHRMSDGLRARKKVLEELPNVNWVAFSGHRLFTLCMKTESGGVVYRKNILSPNDIQQSKTATSENWFVAVFYFLVPIPSYSVRECSVLEFSSFSSPCCVGMLLCVGTMCAVFIPYVWRH